MMQAI